MIYNIGQECGARFLNKACNAYLLTSDKNILIGGVPEAYGKEYLYCIEKYVSIKDIDSIILLTASPECAGCIKELLNVNSNITVYATVAGLRNVRELVNRDFKGAMCKNATEFSVGRETFKSYITPNVTWPDSMILLHIQSDSLYSGELFSSLVGEMGFEDYYEENLRFFKSSVVAALDLISGLMYGNIYPAFGRFPIKETEDAVCMYRALTGISDTTENTILIAYASKTGNNKLLAEAAEKEAQLTGLKTKLLCLDEIENPKVAARLMNECSGMVIGCYTENRSMPGSVWEFLSGLDVNLVSRKPYFVFGSCGWSCEGAYMANEMLAMLKMRKACKMHECTLTPDSADFIAVKNGILQLAECIRK